MGNMAMGSGLDGIMVYGLYGYLTYGQYGHGLCTRWHYGLWAIWLWLNGTTCYGFKVLSFWF
jgi:hypothetical protein